MAPTSSILAVVPEASDFAALCADLAPLEIPVCCAHDLLDAVLHQAASPASVILWDVDGLGWKEAVHLFQRQKTPGAAILLTRRADERLWLEVLDAGAFDLLEKPCRAEALRWVVSTALKRSPERMTTSAAEGKHVSSLQSAGSDVRMIPETASF